MIHLTCLLGELRGILRPKCSFGSKLFSTSDAVDKISFVPAVGGQVLVDGEGPVGGDGVQLLCARLLVEEALGYVIVALRGMAGRPHLGLMFTKMVQRLRDTALMQLVLVESNLGKWNTLRWKNSKNN